MRSLRLGKKAACGLLAIGGLVMVTVLVVLPSVASATPTWQAPASGTYGITPELVNNGGKNNDCSFFYPGSTVNADGTVTLPSGQVLHQFYVNNPKNTQSATDPTTSATFNITTDPKTNQVTSVTSTGAAIVDIGINGGANTTHYNYSGVIAQPSPPAPGFNGFPGTVTGDTLLHPPISGTKNGQTIYYVVSHMAFCYTTGSPVSGTVFTDADHNGVNSSPNSPDTPLANATVKAYKTGSSTPVSTFTNGSGVFAFTTLAPGTTYTICVVKPASSDETVPTSSTANSAACSGTGEASRGYSVNTSTAVTGLNFGFAPLASISGVAFSDTNGDGVDGSGSDFGEPGLNGLTVSVTDTTTNGSPATTTTANDGTHDGVYSFSNLYAGDTYTVCITKPSGNYQQTAPGPGAPCSGTNVAGRGYSFALSSSNGSGRKFGFQAFGTLSGTVYQDISGQTTFGADGNYDFGTDQPLGGWTVNLYKGTTLVDTTTSDTNTGAYSFTELFGTSAQYTTCVTPSSGSWAQSEPLPTAANVCNSPNLPKGQQFTPTSASDSLIRNFGNSPSMACRLSPPFGLLDPLFLIKLTACKPGVTYAFDSGSHNGKPWVSVWPSDQTSSQLVPEVEKIRFPYTSNAQNAFGLSYTDQFPFEVANSHPMRLCQIDPRDPNGPDDQTLRPEYDDPSTAGDILPPADSSDPEDSSCLINYQVNSPPSSSPADTPATVTYWVYSDLDGLRNQT